MDDGTGPGARRVVVHGRVQGVFFRASTRERARGLELSGWVRNDPDGTVTAHLQGEAHAIDELLDWIRDGGPRLARVDRVEVEDVEPADDAPSPFEVAR